MIPCSARLGVRRALGLVLVAVLVGWASSPGPVAQTSTGARAATPWTFPVMVTTTGAGAPYSLDFTDGMDIALREINGAGGIAGRPIVLQPKDTQSNVAQAVSLTQQLCESNTLIVLGPVLSTEAESAFPVANRSGCLIFAPTPSKPGLTAPNRPWTFVLATPTSNLAPTATADVIKLVKPKTGLVITDKSDPAPTEQGRLSEEALKAGGVQLLPTINTSRQDVDFSPVVTRIGAAKPDLLIIAGYDVTVIGLLEELHRQQLGKIPTLVTQAGYTPALLRLRPELLNGIYVYTEFWADNPDARVRAFVEKFRAKRHGETPTQLAAQGYDSLYLLKYTIEKSGVTGDPGKARAERPLLRDALQGVKDWPGITGSTTITDKGYPNKGVYLLANRGGKFEKVN